MHSLIDSTLKRVFGDLRPHGVKDLSWKDGLDLLESTETESREIQEAYLSDLISAVRVQALSLGALAVASCPAQETDPPNKFFRIGFAASDRHLSLWLTNITNTALSIARLCISGFDTQARCLFRCLQERTKQAIILFYSDEDYATWHKAFEVEESKDAFYRLFSRKGRIEKRYFEIEGCLGFHHDPSVIAQRRSLEEEASQPVHGASVAVLMGSFGYEHGSEKVFPATFGYASSASGLTLSQTFWNLLYFQALLRSMLEDVHGWEPDEDETYTFGYLAYREAAVKIGQKLFQQKTQK